MAATFNRLVRFVPQSDSSVILIGEPVDEQLDVGAAVREGKEVQVSVFSGNSSLSPGSKTGQIESISKILSPISLEETSTIRCIGLNYVQHAKEVKMAIPEIPTLFLQPETSLADPSAPFLIPKALAAEGSTDYESELAIVIGRKAKNVSEAEALDYVLGYSAANDISARKSQFAQTQWCFSKGFDGACPIGPVLASTKLVPDPSKLHIRGLKNGKLLQDCGTDDLIFSIPKIVSVLSQGTTLQPGTIILTGTPAGVGHSFEPKEYLLNGDEFSVEILPSIGTLVTRFAAEK
ncbi:hypothetical protein B0O99DRAFT_649892 [Bisporella sp. PMI_857]|nr:hypothetical protein B0O99DRAFT_649892 [Bisporella sp. PMI_857]